MSDLAAEKAALRQRAKAERDRLAQAAGEHPGQALLRQVQASIPLVPGTTVSGYWPMGSEIDVRPLLNKLHKDGHRTMLPVMQGAGRGLLFKVWAPGDALQPAKYGTSEPMGEADFSVPEVLLVPLLAFDAEGYRLGYGGGFYDRTLSELRGLAHVTAIGVAFAGQEVAAVPREATDQPMDWIATEEGVRAIG